MLGQLYRFIRALSLDVVGGSVICALFLGKLLGVSIPMAILTALALAVWVIYTLDHLWDAYRLRVPASSYRHRFHQKHFKVLIFLTVGAIGAAIMLMPILPKATLTSGLGLTLVVGGYFWWLYFYRAKTSCMKEITVSLVYTLGVFTGPVSLFDGTFQGWLVIVFLQFVLLALVNLLEFSYFELETDQLHRFRSAVVFWGRRQTRRVVFGMVMTVIILGAVCIFLWHQNQAVVRCELVLLAMTAVLGIIMVKPRYFGNNERFRILGDGIFLLPALFLLWPQ